MTEYGQEVQGLSEEEQAYWKQEIDRAEQKRKEVAELHDWQGNLDRYAPTNLKRTRDDINTGADFRDVERKKTALMFKVPAIGLTVDDGEQPLQMLGPDGQPMPPPPPQPGPNGEMLPPPPPPQLGTLVAVHQELLNAMLGATEIDLKPTVDKCLLDVLAASGVSAVRVGYQATMQEVQTEPQLDPLTGMELAPAQAVQIPVHETFFVARVSPQALLIPADFKDTDARYMPWSGYRWRKPASQVRREYGLPDDAELPTQDAAKPYFYEDTTNKGAASVTDPQVSGVYIEYRAALRGKATHPDVIWCLALIDGLDQPLKHGPSPNQTIGPDGRLTPDSLTGFSILPLWIRDLPDSAYPPSDCAITGPLTKELNKFRTQMVQRRNTGRGTVLYDTDALSTDTMDAVRRGDQFAGVEGGKLAQGAGAVMAQVVSASTSRDDYTANDYIERDREQILGISANQTGANTQTERSATETEVVQKNSEARFETERERVLAWVIRIARAVDALILRYGDERLSTRILGPRKGPFWAQFRAQMAGGYRYDVQVDSGKYLDIQADRRQQLQFYQMTRQDPWANPKVSLTKLAQAWGIDPAEWIKEPEPPKPPPVQAAVSLKGTDFDPTLPMFPIIVHLARQGGWDIPDTVIQEAKEAGALMLLSGPPGADGAPSPGPAPSAEPKHGGAAPQVMPISKRQAEETGNRTGPQAQI